MRRLLVVLAILAFCSAPTWADSILPQNTELDVNAWSTFTDPAGATETIGVSFLYLTPSIQYEYGRIVPGSLDVGSSGFLGTFSPGSSVYYGYLPFYDAGRNGDEIDLDWSISNTGGIEPGINTASFYIWTCQTQACDNAYGQTWTGPFGFGEEPSSSGSTVTVVGVPDGDSVLWLMVTALGAVGLVWRWRRTDAISFSKLS